MAEGSQPYELLGCFGELVLGDICLLWTTDHNQGDSSLLEHAPPAIIHSRHFTRIFRVFRVGRVAGQMQEFTKILNMIIDVIEPVGNVTILLALFMFIFAILGVQLFGNEDAVVPYLDEDKRYNFHSFTWALYSTFVMLTGENWPGIMFNAIYGMPGGIGDDCNPDLIQPARMGQWDRDESRSNIPFPDSSLDREEECEPSLWFTLFFVIWLILGNYFLVNLVLAILLANSSKQMDKSGRDQVRSCSGLLPLTFSYLPQPKANPLASTFVREKHKCQILTIPSRP